jgi:hypothetical protein
VQKSVQRNETRKKRQNLRASLRVTHPSETPPNVKIEKKLFVLNNTNKCSIWNETKLMLIFSLSKKVTPEPVNIAKKWWKQKFKI